MNKQASVPIAVVFSLAFVACSLVVNADRSKVNDDLYHPSPVVDAGTDADASDATSDAEDAGGGAAGAAGAAAAESSAGTAGQGQGGEGGVQN
jgi:hypothetical protein